MRTLLALLTLLASLLVPPVIGQGAQPAQPLERHEFVIRDIATFLRR